MYKNITNKKN